MQLAGGLAVHPPYLALLSRLTVLVISRPKKSCVHPAFISLAHRESASLFRLLLIAALVPARGNPLSSRYRYRHNQALSLSLALALSFWLSLPVLTIVFIMTLEGVLIGAIVMITNALVLFLVFRHPYPYHCRYPRPYISP